MSHATPACIPPARKQSLAVTSIDRENAASIMGNGILIGEGLWDTVGEQTLLCRTALS